MRKIILFVLLFLGINSFAQSDIIKLNRKEAIRLDSIGEVFRLSKEYKNAIDVFDKALEKDSIYGEAIYHRALAIYNSGIKSCNPINLCDEFKKAMKYGAIISKEVLFFYGCNYKKQK